MSDTIRRLRETVGASPAGADWLDGLPALIEATSHRWRLDIGAPFLEGGACSWVAPCTTSDGVPAALKLGFPHMEARDEIAGLEFWDGGPTVRLLRADPDHNAMLLERCIPGTGLKDEDEPTQDVVLADLFRRLWQAPPRDRPFRPLREMIEYWLGEVDLDDEGWPDRGLVLEATRSARELLDSQSEAVLLATDLHAGNVLRATRAPWLVIDPKPFVGERAFDGTQHLLNCRARMRAAPLPTVERLSDLLQIDMDRFRQWTFVRFALRREYAEESAAIAMALAG